MTANLHRVLWLSLSLACAAASDGLSAALAPEELYQKVLPSVMTLEVENQIGERFVGSAVLAFADDAALTAWHVVADARSVWAVFADGQRVKVTGCIDHDKVRDLALLKLEKRLPHRQAALRRQRPSVASRIYVIGAPKGYDFSIGDGLISQIRNVHGFQQYQLSCPISPGNSGSPIVNDRGEVIGIASWTKSDAQNVSFAIPTQEFSRLNVSGRPTTWEQMAATARPVPLVQSMKPDPTSDLASDKAPDGETAAGSLAAFKKRLHESAGQPVTVILHETGRTNIFTFTAE